MKRTIPKLTKLANALLIVSVLLQFGYLIYRIYRSNELTDSHDVMRNFIDIFTLEMYMIVGSVAAPILFVDLFSRQARGNMAGVIRSSLLILAIMVYEHWSAIQNIIAGQPLTQPVFIEILMDLILPVIMVLSILTSFRPFAIISAIAALAITLYNLSILGELNQVLGQESVAIVFVSETLYGLGLFFGLIGIKKVIRIVD